MSSKLLSSSLYIAYLAQSLNKSGSETTIYVSTIKNLLGETITTADLATLGRGTITIDPLSISNPASIELASFTGIDATNVALTGAVRGLSGLGDDTSTARMPYHPIGTMVIISFGVQTLADLVSIMLKTSQLDTDGTLAANSDAKIASQKAVKTYVTNAITGASGTASTTVFGTVKITTATQTVVSTDDTRMSTADEKAALAGTSGTAPSVSNKFVDAADVASAKTASKIARRDANGDVLVSTTPTSGDAAASKTYVDGKFVSSIGQTTRARNAGTGTVNIAHGLGKAPTLVRITAMQLDYNGGGGVSTSIGSATSTSINKSTTNKYNAAVYQDASNIIHTYTYDGNNLAVAAVSVLDATNITLNFTTMYDNGSAGTLYIQWEAIAY